MKKILAILLLFSFICFAQSKIKFNFDYAQFRYDSSSNYLEIYYSILSDKIRNKNGTNDGDIIMHIQVQNLETDELIINKDWKLANSRSDSSDYSNNPALLGVLSFIIKNGNYNLFISVNNSKDFNKENEYSDNVQILPFNNESYSISQIELASRIINENADQTSIFYKNTLEVFPHPSMLYSNNNPILFYYCELYDLENAKSEKVTLKKVVYNSNNQPVYEKSKFVNISNNAIVEVGAINLQKYPTDSYTLVISLTEPNSQIEAISGKKFFLVNPNVIVTDNSSDIVTDYISSEFGVLSEEECDDLFVKSKIIASVDESNQYDLLDSLNQKREFLYNFWKKRDNVPSTQTNEFKNNFLARVENANARYRTMSTAGFKTDRGRIFLRLGEPDEIDRHPNETNTKPYEIWYYHQIEGGVSFIFGDITGFNYYQLLHSNMRGELKDPDWIRRIRSR
jgi:GWxTD domain-containing protein